MENQSSKIMKSNSKSVKPRWNFSTDYNDHFETPLIAYQDLLLYFTHLATSLHKSISDLIIYDPYYCLGNMVQMLQSIGLPHVINRNRDFYDDVTNRNVPEYDVLVTNPPYSGDHKQRLLEYLQQHPSKPFAILLPMYTANKSYWRDFAEGSEKKNVLYLLPPDMYEYQHPEGTGKDLPPFYSAWFIGGVPDLNRVCEEYKNKNKTERKVTICTSLVELERSGKLRLEKRGNPKQRKRMRSKLKLVAYPHEASNDGVEDNSAHKPKKRRY